MFFRCTYDMWYVDSNMHKLRLKGLICVWMEWKEKFKDTKEVLSEAVYREDRHYCTMAKRKWLCFKNIIQHVGPVQNRYQYHHYFMKK